MPTFVENHMPHLGTREAYAVQKQQDIDGVLEQIVDECTEEVLQMYQKLAEDVADDVKEAFFAMTQDITPAAGSKMDMLVPTKKLGLISKVGTQEIPEDHYHLHLPKLKGCPGCEVGKLQETSAFKRPSNNIQDKEEVSKEICDDC